MWGMCSRLTKKDNSEVQHKQECQSEINKEREDRRSQDAQAMAVRDRNKERTRGSRMVRREQSETEK